MLIVIAPLLADTTTEAHFSRRNGRQAVVFQPNSDTESLLSDSTSRAMKHCEAVGIGKPLD
jgi:hypothetical protein